MSDLYFKGLGYYVTPRSRSRPCASFLKRSRDWLGFLQHHETSDCFSFCICYITIWLFCSYPRAAISGLNMDSLSVWQPREPSSINSKKCNRSLSGFGEREKKSWIFYLSLLSLSQNLTNLPFLLLFFFSQIFSWLPTSKPSWQQLSF